MYLEEEASKHSTSSLDRHWVFGQNEQQYYQNELLGLLEKDGYSIIARQRVNIDLGVSRERGSNN